MAEEEYIPSEEHLHNLELFLSTLKESGYFKVFYYYRKYVEKIEKHIFSPIGESHHDANKCPYCKENLNGKT